MTVHLGHGISKPGANAVLLFGTVSKVDAALNATVFRSTCFGIVQICVVWGTVNENVRVI